MSGVHCKGVCFRGYETARRDFSGPVNTFPPVWIAPIDFVDADDFIKTPNDQQKITAAHIVKRMIEDCPGPNGGKCQNWQDLELGRPGDGGCDVYVVLDPNTKVRGEE